MPSDIIIYKIKPGKHQKLADWYQELGEKYAHEAQETLKDEHVRRESAGIVKINDEYYDVGFVEYDTQILPADPTNELNQKHRTIRRECLEKPPWIGKLLYDFSASEEE